MPNLMCGPEFGTFLGTTIMPMVAYATIITSLIIAMCFMAGRALNNPKLTLYAKTEIIQLGVSLSTVFIITMAVSTFCIIDVSEVADIFGLPNPGSKNIFDAAHDYLEDAARYSHNAISVVRYHLQAYTVLAYLNAFICDFSTGNIGWGCLFGYGGENQQPLGGYGAHTAALNIAFNGALISHFTVLNFIFILLFVYRGFVFMFLPLGIFLRAMPYLRGLGSLFIAISLSFLLVFPFMLSVFYLMKDVILDGSDLTPLPLGMNEYDEGVFADAENGAEQFFAVTTIGEGYVKCRYFNSGDPVLCDGTNKENPTGALAFAANAFIAAVFLPTLALIATIASVTYVARLYGEEIDLSRITQLV